MQSFGLQLRKVYFYTVTALSLVFILGLSVMAAYGTSHLAGNRVYETSDSILLNISAALIPVVLFVLLSKSSRIHSVIERIEHHTFLYIHLRKIVFYGALIQGIIWVCGTQFIPAIDQRNILNAARAIRIGDLGMYSPGGYMNYYPHQMGLVLFCWALSFIFGSWNFLAFQMINAFFYALIWHCLADIAGHFGMNKCVQLCVPLIGMLFTPLLFFCSYVYGIVPGLGLVLLAIRSELRYFETEKRHHAAATGFFLGASAFLKENYLIFGIGMLIFAVMEMIRLKKKKGLAVLLWMLVFLFCSKAISKAAFQHLNSSEQAQGISPTAYIAMGLQDEDPSGPGWWNSYNENSYLVCEYDTRAQSMAAIQNILTTLNDFSTGERDAVEFFLRKISSQWNNPTFMSFWIVRMMSSVMEESDWLWSIKDIIGMNGALRLLNPLQFIILIGTAMYLITCRSMEGYERSLLLLMVFCGGFVFHLFWEARAEYALVYYVLLFPYAVCGYSRTIQYVETGFAHVGYKSKEHALANGAVILAGLVVCAGTLWLSACGKSTVLRASTEEYRQYLQERESTRQPYFSAYWSEVTPYCNEDDILWYHRLQNTSPSFLMEAEDRDELEIVTIAGENRLRIAHRLYVTANDNGTVTLSPYVEGNSQTWYYEPCANDSYAIVDINGMALTMQNDGSVVLRPFSGDKAQRWRFK